MKKQMPVKSKKPAMHKMPGMAGMMKDSEMQAMMKKKGMKH